MWCHPGDINIGETCTLTQSLNMYVLVIRNRCSIGRTVQTYVSPMPLQWWKRAFTKNRQRDGVMQECAFLLLYGPIGDTHAQILRMKCITQTCAHYLDYIAKSTTPSEHNTVFLSKQITFKQIARVFYTNQSIHRLQDITNPSSQCSEKKRVLCISVP